MPSSILNFLGCLLCFRKKRQNLKVIDATRVSCECNTDSRNSTLVDAESLEKRPGEYDSDCTKEKHNIHAHQIPLTPPPSPRTNPSLLVVAKGQYELNESCPFPTINSETEVIIQAVSVGLNPIDWKSVDYGFCLPEFPWITGREMAGVVEQVGSAVTDLKVGQRVWTSTYYRDRRAGCFQHYVTVPQHTVAPIPSEMSFEAASCLGVAGLTAAMSLWHWLEVAGSPALETKTLQESGYILIWGGSAVTGQFAIQIATQSGLKVIAVTSTKTASLARNLGAQHVITRDEKTGDEIVSQIRNIAGDEITRCIDLVGTETASYCLQAVSQTQRVLFAPLAMISSKAVVKENVSVQTVEMKQFVLNESSKVYSLALNRLLEEDKLVLPEMTIVHGGLSAVLEGLERVKRGDMGGKKMVVRMSTS